jgi:AmmeMemoRadiSam system protein B
MRSDTEPDAAIAAIGPHAGYVYSGGILGETYARVRVPGHVVVLCPNHTGLGARRSLWSGGAWELPGGEVPVDGALAERVRSEAGLELDEAAHRYEHSIEVHLPFLRARRPDVHIVPICLANLGLDDCRELGLGLAEAVRGFEHDVLIAASTDMSHYVSAERARKLDMLAIERILALDPAGLHAVVRDQRISMCGHLPTAVALYAAIELGASAAELVRYGNSGEQSGDFERVVGYAGVVVK